MKCKMDIGNIFICFWNKIESKVNYDYKVIFEIYY